MGIKQLDQFGEVRQRPRQAVNLVDDDDVNLAGADIIQQFLKVGAVGGPAGVSPIVISGPDQGPAGRWYKTILLSRLSFGKSKFESSCRQKLIRCGGRL
jgi:hypothetical protein